MSTPFHYSNPLWNGYCADPFILHHGDFYYAYGTHYTPANGAPSHCTPIDEKHFVLLRSRNLASWECLGGTLEVAKSARELAHWAPEVVHANGKFWMYYSAGSPADDTTHRLHVAVADTPEGPFRHVTQLPFDRFAIDASPYQDPTDGRWYLFFCQDDLDGERPGTGIAVVRLDDDMITPLGTPQPAILPHADWQISERNRSLYGRVFPVWHTVEGPHVLKRDDQYYAFYSGGNWQDASYGIAYAIAPHPLGPWNCLQDEATVLHSLPGKVIGPGHNSIVLGPDHQTPLMVYHAWDPHRLQRQMHVDPIHWTSHGPRVYPTRGPTVCTLK